ncbi:MAG: ferric reductase [Aeromicrobium erythreum]
MTLWFLARALGFVALLAFTGSVTLGTLARSGSDGRGRTVRQLVHRSLAVTGLVALLGHLVCIVVDPFVSVGWVAALVPLASGCRPVAVGLGTLALWAFVLAAVSGAARGRLATSPRAVAAWRWVHRSAWVGWLLSLGHGLLAGTDTGTPWAVATYAACAAAVVLAWGATRRGGHPRTTLTDGTRRLTSAGAR